MWRNRRKASWGYSMKIRLFLEKKKIKGDSKVEEEFVEGTKFTLLETAKNFIKLNVPLKKISKATGLSISELKYTKSQVISTTMHRHATTNCLLKCEKVANYRIYAVI